jgi:hypothetical protein
MRKLTQALSVGITALALTPAVAQTRTATLTLDFTKKLGPIQMDHVSLGQGGLSPDPMWDNRIAEIRALHPHLIRLFVQEYFDVLPAPGTYQFATLDRSVDEIVQAGAIPLMSITLRPKSLYPKIDQDIVDPTDYAKWEALISAMVSHYKQQGLQGLYWEVGNEGDIGESGGSPYRFTPKNYVGYYRHTVEAVLRADPQAHVGGPALANYKSPLLPALLDSVDRENLPLSFISWHSYTDSPKAIQGTIEYVKALLAQHPSLHPETVLDEWNMALSVPPTDARIQPAFVAETAWRMKESGLTYSCYYHIRDYHVDRDRFLPYTSPGGASFMASWWNRMPQYSGLFDYQNVMRPAYFAFELLARLTGSRLAATSDDDSVHAFLAFDDSYDYYSLMLWNFSAEPVTVKMDLRGLPEILRAHRRTLDAATPFEDENARLHPLADETLTPNSAPTQVHLEPYGIEFWSLEPHHWSDRILAKPGLAPK